MNDQVYQLPENDVDSLDYYEVRPDVGIGCTVRSYSDCAPYTVVAINKSGKTVTLREDTAKRTDDNGFSSNQKYDYFVNPEGTVIKARLLKDGRWKVIGSPNTVVFGHRRKYYDYSF